MSEKKENDAELCHAAAVNLDFPCCCGATQRFHHCWDEHEVCRACRVARGSLSFEQRVDDNTGRTDPRDTTDDKRRSLEILRRALHVDELVVRALEIACVRPEPGDTLIINLRQTLPDDVFHHFGKSLNEAVSRIVGCRCLVTNSPDGIDLGLVKL